MHRPAFASFLLLLAATASGWCQAEKKPEASAPPVTCDLPPDLVRSDTALPHVAAALAKRDKVEILALGSGSTVGDASGAGSEALAYKRPLESFPYRMIEALQATKPTASFSLTVKGGRNMTADTMLPLLRQELAAHHYDLVVWQTGTVEAVRGLRPEDLRDVIQDGVNAAQAAGADVIMVDPQFSRFLRANTDLDPYEAALQQVAAMTDVALFRRFDLTRVWANNGDIDLERVSRGARDHTISMLNICLGRALATFMLNGAEQPPP